jgi:hypothetical protein
VIAALCGWYAGEKSAIFNIVELNGPGEATWRELMELRRQLAVGYFGSAIIEKGLANIQRNVRNYIYTRSDSMNPGHNWQWKTSGGVKVTLMERLRDFAGNGQLRIRSAETIEEMRTVTREGDSIEAGGTAKDDRVFSLALGVRAWEERARRGLMQARRTRQAEEARRRMSIADQASIYHQSQFQAFLSGQAAQRKRLARAATQSRWGRR